MQKTVGSIVALDDKREIYNGSYQHFNDGRCFASAADIYRYDIPMPSIFLVPN